MEVKGKPAAGKPKELTYWEGVKKRQNLKNDEETQYV